MCLCDTCNGTDCQCDKCTDTEKDCGRKLLREIAKGDRYKIGVLS